MILLKNKVGEIILKQKESESTSESKQVNCLNRLDGKNSKYT